MFAKNIIRLSESIKYLICLILISSSLIIAQETNEELTKAAQNPLADMISIPFRNDTYFNLGPNHDRTGNNLNLQPVIPLFNGKVITRTIAPFIWIPDYTQESGSNFGFGDILFSAFYATRSENLTWGIGSILSIPTGDDLHGSGKWGIGPSAVAIAQPGKWVLGGVISNLWSFAGDENRADVNTFSFQPLINYNFPDFFLTYSPVITANWKADSDNQWTVPLGLGAGKLFKLGGLLPVVVSVSYYNNVVKPEYFADWTLSSMVIILLPASIL
jgi:hypothetical protein